MKVLEIKCTNKNCINHKKYTHIDIYDFIWSIEYSGGTDPSELFLELPHTILCQSCFTLCNWIIKDV